MNKDLSKDFYRYVLPSMVSMLLSGFYSMVDGIFVGNAAGSQALAAINLVYPIQACMNATAFGLGVGGAVLMSKHMGSEEYDQADRAMGTTSPCSPSPVWDWMGFFWLTKDSIIHLLGATGEIAQICKRVHLHHHPLRHLPGFGQRRHPAHPKPRQNHRKRPCL